MNKDKRSHEIVVELIITGVISVGYFLVANYYLVG